MTPVAIWIMQLLISSFLAILFVQSGVDKVVDRQGNVEWLTGHFANSPLAGSVSVMVTTITLVELAAGVLSGAGAFMILLTGSSALALAGAVLSSMAIVAHQSSLISTVLPMPLHLKVVGLTQSRYNC